jgi:DNA (cytosine-5)-methyltransferase 1
LRHLDLFSGIGGFALAARNVWGEEHEVVSFCDIEPFAQKVLKKHWPGVPCHVDIKTMKGSDYANIDILTGGFPCQPFSQAGLRRGTEDDRHLWPEMLRVIREAKPRWIVGENVRGLTNWNGGLVFQEVLSDLEAEGYSVQSFLIPACAIDAPHRRDRIWIVANSFNEGIRTRIRGDGVQPIKENRIGTNNKSRSRTDVIAAETGESQNMEEVVVDTTSGRQSGQGQPIERCSKAESREGQTVNAISDSKQREWPTEPNVGRVAHGIPSRVDRLKGLGNAIVPQVAEMIFRAIRESE